MNNLKKASLWLDIFNSPGDDLSKYLKTIYGNDDALLVEKLDCYRAVLKAFISKYGDRDVVIARSPGRINLMGRHIEHRGGSINTIAIHKETIAVASPRTDDIIHISNTDARFGDFSFSISDELSLHPCNSWLEYIDSDKVRSKVSENRGHWVNYIKSAVLRLSLEADKPLNGMDIMCLGTVPVAGGVSSSSSIVVATAELVCSLNNLSFELCEFISLCGQSEWYVGSRGGAGDHAAIKCGVPGCITPIAFEPIKPLSPIKIPKGHSVIIANSFIEAKKSEGAKDKFNQMVAAYEFGAMLIKEKYPQYENKIIHLRDINPENLGITDKEIYEMLLSLPLFIKPEELKTMLPEKYHKSIDRITLSHKMPEYYNLRSAVLYGISECARSSICSSLLESENVCEFAKIMNISHNGDRVAYFENGILCDYDYYITDEKLYALIEKCDMKDESTQLYLQPGGYGCSVAEIDMLVDKLLMQKGVLSAQLSGAGLGGCIMIFCDKSYEAQVLEFLNTQYYAPGGYPDGAIVVKPIKGAMCLEY